jgi:hypothetical protein
LTLLLEEVDHGLIRAFSGPHGKPSKTTAIRR